MSRTSDDNLRGIPQKPYDLIREGLIMLGFIAVIIIVLAIFWPPRTIPPSAAWKWPHASRWPT